MIGRWKRHREAVAADRARADESFKAMVDEHFARSYPALSRIGATSDTDVFDMLELLARQFEQREPR